MERLMAAEMARLVGSERRAMARRYRRRREARARRAERRRQRGRRGGPTVTLTGRKQRVPAVVWMESEEDNSDSEAEQDDELGVGLEPGLEPGSVLAARVRDDASPAGIGLTLIFMKLHQRHAGRAQLS